MTSQEDKRLLLGKKIRSPIAHVTENTKLVLQVVSEDESEDWGMRNVFAFYLDMGNCV